jgi:hypothetical protein
MHSKLQNRAVATLEIGYLLFHVSCIATARANRMT